MKVVVSNLNVRRADASALPTKTITMNGFGDKTVTGYGIGGLVTIN